MKHNPGEMKSERKAVAQIGDRSSEQLCRHIAAKLGGRNSLLVALSGGLDSTVLTDALVSLRATLLPSLALRAVYIHHGLSARADEWAQHCSTLCQSLRVPFEQINVRVDPTQGGIEAAARTARYLALEQALLPGDTLLTAQHQDDQCETLLLALKRGSGPAGLSSMAAVARLGGHDMLRPLLDISREQLFAYAQSRHLCWVEDESNQDPRFDRNFLRLHILPLLNQRWPHFSQSVARSAALCAAQETLLDELLDETLQRLVQPDKSLAIDSMLAISAIRRNAILRRWLALSRIPMPSKDQLGRIWDEVALSRRDAEPLFQLGNWQIRRFRQQLFILPLANSLKGCVLTWGVMEIPLSLPEELGYLHMSEGGGVRKPRAGERVSVRFSATGIVHIVGRRHGRILKKIWQELNVPPWRRERTPLIFYDEQLIAAPGIFITRQGQAGEEDSGVRLSWLPGTDEEV